MYNFPKGEWINDCVTPRWHLDLPCCHGFRSGAAWTKNSAHAFRNPGTRLSHGVLMHLSVVSMHSPKRVTDRQFHLIFRFKNFTAEWMNGCQSLDAAQKETRVIICVEVMKVGSCRAEGWHSGRGNGGPLVGIYWINKMTSFLTVAVHILNAFAYF